MIDTDTATTRTQRLPYRAAFFKSSGAFLRGDGPKYADVFWAEECPEMLDISITGMCMRGCDFCYRRSTPYGAHLSVVDLRSILEQLRGYFVCQIALGGGNPPLHPEFPEVLRMIREDFGIIPNYTYNGFDLGEAALAASREFCGAVAVSWYDYECWFRETERLINAGIRSNAHFVLSARTVAYATRILAGHILVPDGLNALIFLTHKPAGKGLRSDCLSPTSAAFEQFLDAFNSHERSFKIGFDSCFASALVGNPNIPTMLYDFCEAARFSAFIREDLHFFPCSFAECFGGIDLKKVALVEAWRTAKTFVQFRAWLETEHCDCDYHPLCRGGCPIDGSRYCRHTNTPDERDRLNVSLGKMD